MQKTQLILISFFFICLGMSHAYADNREKAAEELMNAMHMEDLLTNTIEKMIQLQIQQKPKLEPYKKVMTEFFNKYMSYDNMRDKLIKLYTEAFNENELKELTNFYKTPVGQKAIKKVPELTSKGAQMGATIVQQHIEELKKMCEKEAAQHKASKTPWVWKRSISSFVSKILYIYTSLRIGIGFKVKLAPPRLSVQAPDPSTCVFPPRHTDFWAEVCP